MKWEPRRAVLISGQGSNLQVLLDHPGSGICLVVSNKKSAMGLLRAQRAGVSTLVMPAPLDWQALHSSLLRYRIDEIYLLGFMKLLPPDFVKKWQGRLWNLHPSLLPAFPGLRSIELAYEQGAALGVTFHEVVSEMDAGPIRLQKKVLDAVLTGDHLLTFESVEHLIHQTEQELVQRALPL